jgi:urease subunit beta
VIPGEIFVRTGEVELKPGRRRVTLKVSNTGDRPIQVGSHAHFADVNGALAFDRALARNNLLDIPAGTAVRFEAGIERPVDLVEAAGEKRFA